MSRLVFASPIVPEQTTAAFQTVLEDELGSPLGAAFVNTLTLTLYEVKSGNLVNSVDHVNILNTGRGSLTEDGELTVTLLPADNVLLDSTISREKHRMLIEWTYSTTKKGKLEVDLLVENLEKV